MPRSSCSCIHQFQNLGLDGHIQRRGRLVGDQQPRVAGEGHGDHGALAHAAGKLVRILVEALLGVGNARPGAADRWCACALRALLTFWCSRTVSAICVPTVCTGDSEVSGSWKIMEISLPRMLRISGAVGVDLGQVDNFAILAPKEDLAARRSRWCVWAAAA